MARNDLKFAGIAAALDFVHVAVALRLGKRQGTGRDEIFDGDAMRVESDVAAFGLGYGKQVSANASEIDDLRRRSAGIARRHFLCCVVKDAEPDGESNEDTNEFAHKESLDPGKIRDKGGKAKGCQRVLGEKVRQDERTATVLHDPPSSREETRDSI